MQKMKEQQLHTYGELKSLASQYKRLKEENEKAEWNWIHSHERAGLISDGTFKEIDPHKDEGKYHDTNAYYLRLLIFNRKYIWVDIYNHYVHLGGHYDPGRDRKLNKLTNPFHGEYKTWQAAYKKYEQLKQQLIRKTKNHKEVPKYYRLTEEEKAKLKATGKVD